MAGCIMGRPWTASLYAVCLRESSRKINAHTNVKWRSMARDLVQAEEGRGQESLPPLPQNTHKASNAALLRHAVIVQSFG
jgi:hypothetical protein